MSLMSKLSIATILLLNSAVADDKDIISFFQKTMQLPPNVKLKSVEIDSKQKLPIANWYGYIVDLEAEINGKEKINKKMVAFSDGKVVSMDLIDIKTGKSLQDLVVPKLSQAYYNPARLIAGNPNAKNSVVIFSDPLCPFCIDYVPEVIKFVKQNPNNIKLYYYHYPLEQIHPAAVTVAKAMTVLKLSKQMQDVELKFYESDFEKFFTAAEKNETKIIDGINKVLKTKLTLKEIQNPAIINDMKKDIKMGEDVMVPGTPTIFVNGELDKSRKKYETLK